MEMPEQNEKFILEADLTEEQIEVLGETVETIENAKMRPVE